MPREQIEPGTPADWMVRARSALALTRGGHFLDVVYEDLCFDAQQAAEKALKAVLIAYGIAFPRVHDIEALLKLLPADLALPDELKEATALTDYAALTRYPGEMGPLDEEDYDKAVLLAEFVVAWAEAVIEDQVDTADAGTDTSA